MILRLFRTLCDDLEPAAVKTFIAASRRPRYEMLRNAMQTYRHLLKEAEISLVEAALKRLDKLAEVRNQIAHGNVVNYSSQVGEEVAASGMYLLPSLSAGSYHEREFKFHHTTATIKGWVQELRQPRGDIMDVSVALLMRMNARRNFGSDAHLFIETARRIARMELHGQAAVEAMRQAIGYVEAGGDREAPD